LNNFLGMPSDEGMRPGNGNWTGAQGAVAGAAAANRNDPRFSGAQGAVAGAAYANRNPGVGYGAGFGAYAPGARYGAAAAVRSGYNNYGLYGSGWYGNHPGAWAAAGWAAGAAWNAASWNTAGAWCGYANTYPTYYDYGNNVTYQDGNVYMNGQDNGSAADYYNQASTLASTGAEADAPSDGEWLPLGVFAASKQGETGSHITIQLAINKAGILRGNETDTDADTTQPIQGSLDKQSQKVAFTIGDDTSRVVETGLYNLTKDESPGCGENGTVAAGANQEAQQGCQGVGGNRVRRLLLRSNVWFVDDRTGIGITRAGRTDRSNRAGRAAGRWRC
jgi:hypothetical protein